MERTPAAPFISRAKPDLLRTSLPRVERPQGPLQRAELKRRHSRPFQLLFLRRRPAAFGAVVAAERALHLGAGDAAGEVAAHAFVVHVGEADPESVQPRLAQARED